MVRTGPAQPDVPIATVWLDASVDRPGGLRDVPDGSAPTALSLHQASTTARGGSDDRGWIIGQDQQVGRYHKATNSIEADSPPRFQVQAAWSCS